MRQILAILLLTIVGTACSSKKSATISGTFSGVSEDTLFLELITTKERRVVDSVVTDKEGDYKFRVKLPVTTPTFYNIKYKQSIIPVILSPGDRMKVNSLCDIAQNYTVEGSKDSETIKAFNTIYRQGVSTLDSLSEQYATSAPGATYDARRKELISQYTRSYLKIKREQIAFIISNATSMAAIYALYQRLPNDESLFNLYDDHAYYRLVADSLTVRYPQSAHVLALQKDVETQNHILELEQRMKEQANSTNAFPEIELNDMYDKAQKLSAMQGALILVDFWTATDKRNTIMNAELKDIYKTFAPKGLKVFQVSMDNNRPQWITQVQTQKLPWTSVNDPRGAAGLAAMSYNVTSLPTNILINKEGAIIGRNLYGEALKRTLTELTK